MLRRTFIAAAAAATTAFAAPAFADGHGMDIVDTAAAAGNFTTLLAAAEAAGLVDTLKSEGPFTVFAPTDEAFAALPEGTVETLLQPDNVGDLTNILLYHVDDRELMASDFAAGANYYKPILDSERLCITSHSGVTIADGTGEVANVVIADIEASNGVIHVIDKVLLPGTRPACH